MCGADVARVVRSLPGAPGYGLIKRETPGSLSFDNGLARAIGWVAFERTDTPLSGMEPERPKVDRAITGFLKAEKLHPADFVIRGDWVVRLNPVLARHVAALAMQRSLP